MDESANVLRGGVAASVAADTPTGESSDSVAAPLRWKLPLFLFVLTVLSTLFTGAQQVDANAGGALPEKSLVGAAAVVPLARAAAELLRWLGTGWVYSVPLMSILLCHEFGHYLMARKHRVPATLPMFIPMPFTPFGTMGAVIKMEGRISNRNALLDIGAAGPLAGLAIALPVTYIGLRLSPVTLSDQKVYTQEGTSILYGLLKFLAKGSIPPGHDVFLHPAAMAGWVGMLVTMINLIPYGQLDGGHVAYALFQDRHDRFAPYVLRGLLALAAVTGIVRGLALSHAHRDAWAFGSGYTQGINWVIFAGLIWLLHRGTGGLHPRTDPGTLTPGRRFVASLTLACFALLFMPVPLRVEILHP